MCLVYDGMAQATTDCLLVCAGVFAVDGAFNAAVTPDVSGALAPVVQPFLGQLVTGVCTLRSRCARPALTRSVAPAVLSLALLLWYRPYERPLHNIVQAVRPASRCGELLQRAETDFHGAGLTDRHLDVLAGWRFAVQCRDVDGRNYTQTPGVQRSSS